MEVAQRSGDFNKECTTTIFQLAVCDIKVLCYILTAEVLALEFEKKFSYLRKV